LQSIFLISIGELHDAGPKQQLESRSIPSGIAQEKGTNALPAF